MTYQTEFPDFPPETMPRLPACLSDASWHNSVCPSFVCDALGVTVWVDYLDPARREFIADNSPRYVAQDQRDGIETGAPDLYQGDSLPDLLSALLLRWFERQQIQPACALESLERPDLTPDQRAWLRDFVEAWDAAQ